MGWLTWRERVGQIGGKINWSLDVWANFLTSKDDELTRLNSAIDNLSERVDIHCEKVARREVGALTARKPISKAPTIITPVNPERPVKYVRKQINYGELDEIGHGVKMGAGGTMRQSKNASINSRSTISRSQSQLDERYDILKSSLKQSLWFLSRSQYNTIGRAVGVPTIPRSMAAAPPVNKLFKIFLINIIYF